MDKLGIIGGLGPMATAIFMKRIIEMTDAATDQEHIEMVVLNYPSIPDRTGYLLDNSNPDPVKPIVQAGLELANLGCREIAIPCITAHGFHSALTAEIPIPVINGVELTAQYLADRGCRRVGIMATDGTVRTGIFEAALQEHGITPIYPAPQSQKLVMSIIYDDVKAGRPVKRYKFIHVKDELLRAGAQVILLGCTELSVMAETWLPGGRFLDVLSVLARRCVMDFAKLKDEYIELI